MVEEVLKSKNSLTVLNRMNHSNQTSIFSPECLLERFFQEHMVLFEFKYDEQMQ